jgi:hypothetical protein
MQESNTSASHVRGGFVTVAGERYYLIEHVDKMAPFFISLVSDSDHWFFVGSNGGLTAGRVSPETALFPYDAVDRIYDSALHTGSRTLLRANINGQLHAWEPFNHEHDDRYEVTRNLYKNQLGNKLLFEEINHDLELAFRYRWATSNEFGFVRDCELENLGTQTCLVELLDGLQNILPAGTPRRTQANASYLVDAYKWSELDEGTGLAFFTLYSGITDRAEPCESLRTTTVFCTGLEDYRVVLCNQQLDAFRRGEKITQEAHKRGLRGAYLVNTSLELPAKTSRLWQLVADIEQSQSAAVDLLNQLADPGRTRAAVDRSIINGSDALARILAASDGFQLTAEENVTAHHYANVLFNILRGGIFDNNYLVSSDHFIDHIRSFNKPVYEANSLMMHALPAQLNGASLLSSILQQGDPQLERLFYEYLPITFGRRHGDPSRPWNEFAIALTDEQGNRLLSYQGNWRDIFQNWEALLLSYPEFIENVIAKFVNASTADGYNPYRISNAGIDWETEEPDDPWSYIGYWGDHQIIYLLKLLELSLQFHPEKLGDLMCRAIFSYANVPYCIKPLKDLLQNARSTVVYDHEKAERIEKRVAELGADGRLLVDASGGVYQVNLLEKLLVPLLCKLGNLVIDGGIWLNTQRPEWNDANNALVGNGLSMVTLYYLRRYVTFLHGLLSTLPAKVDLSTEVAEWLADTADVLDKAREQISENPLDNGLRHRTLVALGESASRYRQRVYQQEGFTGLVAQDLKVVGRLLEDAITAIDHSIRSNRRGDGLYHSYNLLELTQKTADIDSLYPMLEGQVAALSSGAIGTSEAVALLETLFESSIFRQDQNTFMLYPDRELPGFLQKNCVPAERVEVLPLLKHMLQLGDYRVIERDASGTYRFNAELTNEDVLHSVLEELSKVYGDLLEEGRVPLLALYEQVFNHKAFTGRSGGMFAFEGLGSIYWHMVSKLLLAIQENFFNAWFQDADPATCRRLGSLYYRVRGGIGFNKTPGEYGAFPTDPYSHTPGHVGAQQPGMTGQVKEEILTRFGELGVRVGEGAVHFQPRLLRSCEFLAAPQTMRFLHVNGQWQELMVPASGLAFTWCQVPMVYQLDESAEPALTVHWDNGDVQAMPALELPPYVASELFERSGRIEKIVLVLNGDLLFNEGSNDYVSVSTTR